MDDRLFTSSHIDSKILTAASAAVSVPPLAGSPPQLGTAGSGAGTPVPDSPLIEGPDDEIHGASCECIKCRVSSSLDPSELTVSEPVFSAPPPAIHLQETSLCSCFRHGGWAPTRRKVFEALMATGQSENRIAAFARCGANSWVKQSKIQQKGVDGVWRHSYQVSGDHCHDRMCTPCANLRSFTIRDRLMAMVGEKKVVFITLTLLGAGQNLCDLVERLYKHFRALRIHPTWADRVTGGAAFIEVKWNEPKKRWHPHLHIICESSFLPQAELSNAWHSITKDSMIVHIKPVTQRAVVASYVCKYASKPLDGSFAHDPRKLGEAIMALKGRRLCLTFGTWYGTPLTYAEDEELADEGDMVAAGGYENLCPFETILNNAASGDSTAIHILRSLNMLDRLSHLLVPSG